MVRRGPGRAAQVAGGLLAASLATALQYRSDFWMEMLTGLSRSVLAFGPVWLVFSHRETVLGWSADDTVLVLGLYLLVHALLAGFVEPNLGAVVESIRAGTLDFVLLKPADAQLLVSVRRLAVGRLIDVPLALGVIAWALAQRELPSGSDVMVALVLLVSGLVAMYSLWLLAICTSFWFVRVDNLRFLLWSMVDAGRWPLPVFTPWVRWFLTVVVPIGVVTTFPALALRGEWDARLLGLGIAVGIAFAVGSRWAWHRSLAAYTSASS